MTIARLLAGVMVAAVLTTPAHAGCGTMADRNKLDPRLLEQVDISRTARSDTSRPVQVLVGLDRAATPEMLDDLKGRGLNVRSVLGDVLTGTVALDRVDDLAAHDSVVKIEASGPTFPEDADEDAGPPIDID